MPQGSQLERPVALITGASYGVGAATALALARGGFAVGLTATKSRNLEATLTAVDAAGGRSFAIELDLNRQESIEAAVANAVDRFGKIDVLVNNAGTTIHRKAADVTRPEWNAVMSTNMTGTFFLTQQVGRHLIGRGGGGCIISVASTHALVGTAERSAYGISKAALIQMTKMLAIEWAGYGVRVNAVAPGRLDTASPSRTETGSDNSYMDAMLKRIPLHRLATVEEVAGTVAFLAGPLAASITGQTIVIDGGLTAT